MNKGTNVHGQPYLTERGKSLIQIVDAECPGCSAEPEGSIMEQLAELEESIGLWGDLLADAIDRLEYVESEAKAEVIKEDVRMIRAHIQECKIMVRQLKMEAKKTQKDIFEAGEHNTNDGEQLTA